MKTRILIILILIVAYSTAHAQTIREATWVASVEQEVRNIHNTQLNVPLIETKSNNLFALEPATGQILWKLPLRQPVRTLDAITGTPCTLLDSATLIDIGTGKSMDLTSLIKGKLKGIYLIPDSYDLVLYSKDPDYFLVMGLYDFSVRWNQRADLSGKAESSGKTKLAGAFGALQQQTGSQPVTVSLECAPISNKAGGLIIAGNGKLTNVDNTGKVIWQVDQPKKKKGGLIKTVDNQTELLVDETSDQFYILKSKLMTAVKLSDGSTAWPEFYEVKGNTIVDMGDGLIPMTVYKNGTGGGMLAKSKLNMVSGSTGKPMWPAELEINGTVDTYQVLDDGNLAIVTFNETNSRFQIIDVAQGKFSYAEEVKLKGRVQSFIVGKEKILFATTRGTDLVERATGKDLLSRMQKFDKDAAIFTVYKGPSVYNFDSKNKKVYRTDLLTDASVELIRDFKFQAGEDLVKYDVLENGNVFVASDHHLQVFSPAGQLIVDKPFDYSGRGLARLNNTADKMGQVATVISVASSLALSGVALGISPNEAGASFAYSMVAPELSYVNLQRNEKAAKFYLALKRQAQDLNVPGSFFVRRDKEAKKEYLSYVNKTTGEVVFDIPLAEDSKNPEYAISESTGFVYYAPQFVNENKVFFQAIFDKNKLNQAEQSNRMGLVAAYKFF